VAVILTALEFHLPVGRGVLIFATAWKDTSFQMASAFLRFTTVRVSRIRNQQRLSEFSAIAFRAITGIAPHAK
jgi:hypothetical protein